MRMKMYGQIDLFLKSAYKFVSIERKQKVSHIFYTNDIRTHVLVLLSKFYKVIYGMNFACSVAECSLNRSAVLFGALNRLFDISRIVKRIEYTNNIDTVFDR